MAETTIAEKYSQRRWYYVLFFVFGTLAGMGVTALILVPQTNAIAAANDVKYQALKHDFDTVMDLNTKLQDTLRRSNETMGRLLTRVKNDESAMDDINKAMEQSNRTLALPNPIQRQNW
jgi:hypothetical protein